MMWQWMCNIVYISSCVWRKVRTQCAGLSVLGLPEASVRGQAERAWCQLQATSGWLRLCYRLGLHSADVAYRCTSV